MNLVDMRSEGVEWGGTGGDTQFYKISGSAGNETGRALYDVMLGRVNSSGSFTELYVKLSRWDEATKMYLPKEFKLDFPEVPDPEATWADVWKGAFVESANTLITGLNYVPLRFGLNVIKFAEMADQSFKGGGEKVVNDSIGK